MMGTYEARSKCPFRSWLARDTRSWASTGIQDFVEPGTLARATADSNRRHPCIRSLVGTPILAGTFESLVHRSGTVASARGSSHDLKKNS